MMTKHRIAESLILGAALISVPALGHGAVYSAPATVVFNFSLPPLTNSGTDWPYIALGEEFSTNPQDAKGTWDLWSDPGAAGVVVQHLNGLDVPDGFGSQRGASILDGLFSIALNLTEGSLGVEIYAVQVFAAGQFSSRYYGVPVSEPPISALLGFGALALGLSRYRRRANP